LDLNNRAKGKRVRALSVIDIDDNLEDVPVAETDEAKHGMTYESLSNSILTLSQQIASQKIGMHQSMHPSILSHPSTTSDTHLNIFMSLSAMQGFAKEKA
jgi:hypothetical protein